MQRIRELINRLPWGVVAIAGPALIRPINILDLLMHGAPFIVAAVKFAAWRRTVRGS